MHRTVFGNAHVDRIDAIHTAFDAPFHETILEDVRGHLRG